MWKLSSGDNASRLLRQGRLGLFGLLCMLLVAACTPRVQLPGDTPVQPRLSDNHLITEDGVRLPLHRWEAFGEPAAVVIAVHGFNDYGNFISGLAGYLQSFGVTTLAYDQRGFGASPQTGIWAGEARLQSDLRTLIRLVNDAHPELPLFVLGESMGGAVVLTTLADWKEAPVSGAVLSAPAVWGISTWPWYQRWALRLGAHTLPWMRLTGEGLDIRASDNDDVLRQLGRDPLVIKGSRLDTIWGLASLMESALQDAPHFRTDALILYGEQDQIIPRAPTEQWITRLPAEWHNRQRLVLYAEGYHMLMRDLQAEQVWADIAAWLKDQEAPLPSGADLGARQRLQGVMATDITTAEAALSRCGSAPC